MKPLLLVAMVIGLALIFYALEPAPISSAPVTSDGVQLVSESQPKISPTAGKNGFGKLGGGRLRSANGT